MLTVASLVDRLEPYLKRAIEAELPLGTRWVAHKIARWKIRTVLHALIALYGHQVSRVLGEVEPLFDRLFKAEVAAALRDVKGLCDTPVATFGAWAIEARADAAVSGQSS